MERVLTKLGGKKVFVSASQIKPGDSYKGTYLGSHLDEKFGKMKHRVRAVDGTEFVLPSHAAVDRDFAQLNAGTYVEMTYLGKEIMQSGKGKGKEKMNYELLADLENAPQAQPVTSQAPITCFAEPAFPIHQRMNDDSFSFEAPSMADRITSERAKFNK